MTKTDLQKIEVELSVRLPAYYGALMTGADAQAATGQLFYRFLFNDPKVVVRDTLWLRELMASYDLAFKLTFVAVSEVNGGDVVLMDAAEESEALLVWDHETNTVSSFGCTLSEFANA